MAMATRLANCNSSFRSTLILVLLAAVSAQAGTLDVAVVDVDGQPVPDVAVYVTSAGDVPPPASQKVVMDQRDTQFVPHILVVQKGTSVEFPNSDVVAHHVYSFSKPNNFVLPLYKGDPHNPVVFEHDGIVTLGCNIHDDMLGYIVVVDTDKFGITDDNGRLSVVVDDMVAKSVVNIWSPRIRDRDLSQAVAGSASSATFSLQKKLRPPHDPGTEGAQWSEY
jgi:plastocyanin